MLYCARPSSYPPQAFTHSLNSFKTAGYLPLSGSVSFPAAAALAARRCQSAAAARAVVPLLPLVLLQPSTCSCLAAAPLPFSLALILMGKRKEKDRSEVLPLPFDPLSGAAGGGARVIHRRDGSLRVAKPFPRALGDDGAQGTGARALRGATAAEPEPKGGGDDADDDVDDGPGGPGAPPQPPQAESAHSRRIRREKELYGAQRAAGAVSYAAGREALDAHGQRLLAIDLRFRQEALDNAIHLHPAVAEVYSLIDQEPDAAARARLIAEADEALRLTGLLGEFSYQTVTYVSLRGTGVLRVPSFSIGGVPYTPPASTCLCMSTSLCGPVKGTIFFDWALLDFVTFCFLKGGVAMSGEVWWMWGTLFFFKDEA